MEKEFWISIARNDYRIPEGHTLEELSETLFSYLGSTDPELRDDTAYIVYANFLKSGMYSKDEVGAHVGELLSNLENGIGELGSDTIFLRAFSILFLAEIVYRDNHAQILDQDQIKSILKKGLWYLDAEKDPRGYIPIKGWAHALAHTADLMQELGKSRFIGRDDLEGILRGITDKLIHSTDWVYIHGEDVRLANAVAAILQRKLLTTDFLVNWLKSFTEPEKPWKGAYMDVDQAMAFHNTRNFLRSVLLKILSSHEIPEKEMLQNLFMESVNALAPY